jgi:capsular polysaccharide biosynthesis protein
MEEQPLDLRAAFRAVRRRWLLVAALVAIGLGAGTAYAVKTPPMPEARSLVLLPPSAVTGNPGPSPYTQTQEIIATSAPVLSAAGASVSPPLDATSLRSDVTVTAPSQDVLQINVRAQTLSKAERLADAVATNYIAYVAGTANGSQKLLTQLQAEAAQLTKQILALQRQINRVQSRLAVERAASPASQGDTSLLNSLRTEQEQLSIELDNVNTQIVNAQMTTAQATSATQVLQRAEPVGASSARVPLITLLGTLAGLVAGCVMAVGLAGGDHRLRSRDAVAAALGVPVLASMWAKPCKKVNDWRRLLEHSKYPSALEAWNARRVLRRIIPVGEATDVELQLVVFSGDGAGITAAVKIAGAAAALGMASRLEVGPHPALAALRAACVVTQSPVFGAATVDLKADNTTSTELSGLKATVKVEAIERSKPKLSPSFTTTLLVVSSGFATSVDLARAALAASDAGGPLTGVVVTNPDPDDSTTGLLSAPGERLDAMPSGFDHPLTAELVKREQERRF